MGATKLQVSRVVKAFLVVVPRGKDNLASMAKSTVGRRVTRIKSINFNNNDPIFISRDLKQ